MYTEIILYRISSRQSSSSYACFNIIKDSDITFEYIIFDPNSHIKFHHATCFLHIAS